jgi:hypothetical protein
LSGEASTLITRQSQSTGALEAQAWLAQQFTLYLFGGFCLRALRGGMLYLKNSFTLFNFGFSVTTQPFRDGFSSNVIATLTGTTEPSKLVLVTAHYDDRGKE